MKVAMKLSFLLLGVTIPSSSADGLVRSGNVRQLVDVPLTDIAEIKKAMCEGPCSSDSNCETGLVCFKRDAYEAVPGCSGEGRSGRDYCTKPESDNALLTIGDNGEPADAFPLGLCRGDCDKDADCEFGLVCHEQKNNEPVPGCSGRGTNRDYCINPPADQETLVFKKLPGRDGNAVKLGMCEGHCESHADCEDGLVCFDRSRREDIHGCSGNGDWGANYCFKPRENEIINDPRPSTSNSYSLSECHGNCMHDSDCEYGLQCMHRSDIEPVQGCVGTGRIGSDICYKNLAENALVLMGDNSEPAENFPLGMCQGNCRKTQDCAFGLVCFDRGVNNTVPGCEETGGQNFRDYCTAPSQPNELVFRRLDGREDSAQVLGACEGECTDHSQCGEGLKCFFRSGSEEVPGCTGRAERRVGYCFEATVGESLVFNGFPSGASTHNLGLCEGNCRSDSDCQRGLICHKRDGLEPVPGCTNSGRFGADYCVSPSDSSSLIIMGMDGLPAENYPLDECQGHCKQDADCQMGLTCFDRGVDGEVPNCTGQGQSHRDYCIRRQSETKLVLGRYEGRTDSRDVNAVPLGVCEGDCRSHMDCADGLYCFSRSSTQRIPGCDAGGQRGASYCYDPKTAACTSTGSLDFTASVCSWETFISQLNEDLSSKGCEHDGLTEVMLLLGIQSSNEVEGKFKELCSNAIAAIDRSGFKDFDSIAADEKNTVFTKAYYNGGTDWNDLDVATPGIAETFQDAKTGGISWPGDKEIMKNFQRCDLDTVMCCWTKDVEDNSDACYVDMNRAPSGPHTRGFAVYNGNEGDLNCVGYTWDSGNTMNELYKGNSLFHISMYEGLSQNGYKDNLPGAHVCGCIEKMPVVTRADCTEMIITQEATFSVGYNSASVSISDAVQIEYTECEGVGKNNDLLAHYEKLANERKQSSFRLGRMKERLVGQGNCPAATEKWLAESKGWTTA